MELVLKLTKSSDSEPESTMVFTEEGGVIGRLPDCRWQLKDMSCSLSREHARIYMQNGLFYVEDTSTNGVCINDAVVSLGRGNSHLLSVGDKISMGEYAFSVESIQLYQPHMVPLIPSSEETEMDSPVCEASVPDEENLDEETLINVQTDDIDSRNSNTQPDSLDPLSDLIKEENSLLKSEPGNSEHLFTAAAENEELAKNSDEFMADLTGDYDKSKPESYSFKTSSLTHDTHDVNVGTAFNMPGTIPEGFDFLSDETVVDNGHEDLAETSDITLHEDSKDTAAGNAMNLIPDGFIPDLSSSGITSEVCSDRQQNPELITQDLIPENYKPDVNIVERNTVHTDNSNSGISRQDKLDLERSLVKLLESVGLNINDFVSAVNHPEELLTALAKGLRQNYDTVLEKFSPETLEKKFAELEGVPPFHTGAGYWELYKQNYARVKDNRIFFDSDNAQSMINYYQELIQSEDKG